MALPACLTLGEDVFPRVRAQAARRLVDEAGWSQARTAEALNVSQAMVSRYVAAPPAARLALADRLADELVAQLTSGRPASGMSPWCSTLSVAQTPSAHAAMDDLLAAERALRVANPIGLVPQIGLNLARALPDATDAGGVLSFPGRLVEAAGKIVSPAPPSFGASGHLARCLLMLRERERGLVAIASVAGGPRLQTAARRAKWSLATLPSRTPPKGDGESRFEAAVRRSRQAPTRLLDPGALGIEPCLYVAGTSAQAVVEDLLFLNKHLVQA